MHTFTKFLPNGNMPVSEIENCVTNSTDWITLRALAKMFNCEEYLTLSQHKIADFLDNYVKKTFKELSANNDSGVNHGKLTETCNIVLREMHEHAIDERNSAIAALKKFAGLILLCNLGLAIVGTYLGATGQPTTGFMGFQIIANFLVLAWLLVQDE